MIDKGPFYLTALQKTLLFCFVSGETTKTKIQKGVGLTFAYVNDVVSALESEGLIESHKRGREVLLFVTEKGAKVAVSLKMYVSGVKKNG